MSEAIPLWLDNLGCFEHCDMTWLLKRGQDVLDINSPNQPLRLHLSGRVGKKQLQSLVSHWHADRAGKRALVHAPNLLCLHILRFHQTKTRRFDPIVWDSQTIQIPIFDPPGSTSILWQPYLVRSGIQHEGQQATSGHYRAIGFDQCGRAHLWDDCATSQPCSNLLYTQRHICVLWLTKAGEEVFRTAASLTTQRARSSSGIAPSEPLEPDIGNFDAELGFLLAQTFTN